MLIVYMPCGHTETGDRVPARVKAGHFKRRKCPVCQKLQRVAEVHDGPA